jgi:cytochrome P450
MATEVKRLGLLDTLRFHLGVTTPGLLWGLVAPNRLFVPLLCRLNAGRCVARTLDALRRKHACDHFWVHFSFGGAPTLLALNQDSMHALLSSDKNQADPKLKKQALSKFVPDALTISSGDEWRDRRQFNEQVLDTDHHLHRYSDAFNDIACAEVDRLAGPSVSELSWADFQALAQRISQQVLLGSGELKPELAEQVARLVIRSNWPFLPRARSSFSAFYQNIERYLSRHCTAPNNPCTCLMHDSTESLKKGSATDATRVPSQIGFWVFVLKDSLELHVSRTLALIAAHRQVQDRVRLDIRSVRSMTAEAVGGLQYLEACVGEQLRLWTPVPMLLRRAVEGFSLRDISIALDQEILIYPGFYHRDPGIFGKDANRFSPDSVGNGFPRVYYFSQGRQACAGQHLARFLLKAILAALLAKFRFELIGPRIDPAHIPYLYNHFKVKFRVTPDS